MSLIVPSQLPATVGETSTLKYTLVAADVHTSGNGIMDAFANALCNVKCTLYANKDKKIIAASNTSADVPFLCYTDDTDFGEVRLSTVCIWFGWEFMILNPTFRVQGRETGAVTELGAVLDDIVSVTQFTATINADAQLFKRIIMERYIWGEYVLSYATCLHDVITGAGLTVCI